MKSMGVLLQVSLSGTDVQQFLNGAIVGVATNDPPLLLTECSTRCCIGLGMTSSVIIWLNGLYFGILLTNYLFSRSVSCYYSYAELVFRFHQSHRYFGRLYSFDNTCFSQAYGKGRHPFSELYCCSQLPLAGKCLLLQLFKMN